MTPLCRALIILPLAFLGGCEKPPEAQRAPAIVTSDVVRLQPRRTSVRITGSVAARISSELAFQVTGRVIERFVDVGSRVAKGDELAKLDPTEQLADLASAKAALASSEAEVRAATANFERQQTLLSGGFTTRVTFEQAQQALNAAQGGLAASKARLGSATEALGYTTLRANSSGVITARNVEVGQVVQSSQSSYTLAQDDGRDAVFDVYEAIFLQKLDGDSVRVSLVSNPDITAFAKVREISPAVDPKTGTVRVKMDILNVPKEMTLGAAVIGEGITKSVDKIVLPSAAVTSSLAGPAVWVIDPATQRVSLRDIQIESYETDSITVSSGISVGEHIVTSSGKMLRPDAVVTYAGMKQ